MSVNYLRVVYKHFKDNTISGTGSEILHGLLLAPLFETLVFCYLPYQLYLQNGKFWEIGIVSSSLFTLIHLRFGKYFLPLTFILGLLFWTMMVKFGLLSVIVTHFLIVVVDLSFGWRKFLRKQSVK
jgi:membrane protease YdiL (CAAX protease family)